MPIQKRRSYSKEFKADAVQLVLEQGYTPPQAAESLGIDASMLRRWIRAEEKRRSGESDAGREVLCESEREELLRLRRDVKRLEMEREILKKATAFFAKESH